MPALPTLSDVQDVIDEAQTSVQYAKAYAIITVALLLFIGFKVKDR